MAALAAKRQTPEIGYTHRQPHRLVAKFENGRDAAMPKKRPRAMIPRILPLLSAPASETEKTIRICVAEVKMPIRRTAQRKFVALL